MRARNLYRGLAIGVFTLGAAAGFAAAPTEVTEPINADRGAGAIDIGAGDERPARPAAAERPVSGNPLWAIPLKDLTATRDRPIFSPSRRPPPPAVVAKPYVPLPPPPKPAEPDRPQLALIGTVAGENDGLGIFLDQTTNKVIRLKLGDSLRGWVLRGILRREVTLEKDQATTVLALPAPALRQEPAGTQLAEQPGNRRDRR
jgi:general secretion pathway protein N